MVALVLDGEKRVFSCWNIPGVAGEGAVCGVGGVAALQAAGGQVRIAGWVCLEGHLGRGRFVQFSKNRDTQAPTGHRSRGVKSAGETGVKTGLV